MGTPTDAMFANVDDPEMLVVPFIFDAAYCLVISANEMLAAGLGVADIKGDALLDKVRACNFEGISGTSVVFNEDGDRLASYFIQNAQTGRRLRSQATEDSMPRQLATRAWVTVAEFRAATDEIIMGASNTFHWASGDKGSTLSADFVACAHGYFIDQRGLCVECQSGSWTLSNTATKCRLLGELCDKGYTYDPSNAACTACAMGKVWGPTGCSDCMAGTITDAVAQTKCNGCGTGTYQKTTGKTACTNCPVGRAAGELSTVQCPLCQAGTFAVTTGQTMCTRCPVGSLTGDKGATACSSCQDHLKDSSTLFQGANSPADCICMVGSYKGDPLLGTNRGVKCTEDMLCDEARQVKPKQDKGYYIDSKKTDQVSVYRCRNQLECPSGDAGACAKGRTGVGCGNCVGNHYKATGGKCLPWEGEDLRPILFTVILLPVRLVGLYIYSKTDVSRLQLTTVTASLITGQLTCTAQSLSVVRELDIQWDEPVNSFLRFIKLFAFD